MTKSDLLPVGLLPARVGEQPSLAVAGQSKVGIVKRWAFHSSVEDQQ